MRDIIIILLLLISSKNFGQSDSTKSTKTVHIRLGRPASENYQPLYIVDGKPISEKEAQNVNPKTIESIKVLKDSNSTFCSGRKNLIVITTKKYSKENSVK